MKINIKYAEYVFKLIIAYEKNERECLDKKMAMLNLPLTESRNLFGKGIIGKFYKSSGSELLNFVRSLDNNLGSITDDVNAPIINEYGDFNLALFRVAISDEVETYLPKYLNLLELKELIRKIGLLYKAIFEIPEEGEVTITFVGEEEKK